jgi:hypothetical protein
VFGFTDRPGLAILYRTGKQSTTCCATCGRPHTHTQAGSNKVRRWKRERKKTARTKALTSSTSDEKLTQIQLLLCRRLSRQRATAGATVTGKRYQDSNGRGRQQVARASGSLHRRAAGMFFFFLSLSRLQRTLTGRKIRSRGTRIRQVS